MQQQATEGDTSDDEPDPTAAPSTAVPGATQPSTSWSEVEANLNAWLRENALPILEQCDAVRLREAQDSRQPQALRDDGVTDLNHAACCMSALCSKDGSTRGATPSWAASGFWCARNCRSRRD